MSTKELTARVRLETHDAESKLKKLASLLEGIDKIANGKARSGKLEQTLGQQLIYAEKLKQATLKTQLAEEKLNAQKQKNLATQNKIAEQEAKSAQKLADGDKAAQKLNQTNYKRWWQEVLTAHAIDGEVKAMGSGDAASKRLTASAQKRKRVEYEVWWQTQLVNQEYRKAFPLVTKLADKLKVNKDKTAEWGNKTTDLLSKFTRTKSTLGSIGSKLKGIIGMYAGVQGLKLMFDTSDTITKTENQLNNIEGGSPERTALAMDKVYASAQRSRGSYSAMLSDVGKLMTLSADAFQNNEDNAIRFQEIMNKAYKLGNMSAAEQATSMYQLVQALGSGILQGDELRSVREGASLMYKEMEKNIQAVLDTDKSLKDLAADGLITSDMVVWAVMQSGDKIDEQFKNTQMTFEDVGTRIKNVATQVMRKVQDRLVTLFNSDKGKKFLENISKAIVIAGNALIWLIDLFANLLNWCVDNWDWLKHVIVGVFIAMIAWTIASKAISVLCAYQKFKAEQVAAYGSMKAWWAANSSMILGALKVIAVIMVIVMAVMALIYVFYLWKTDAIETCDAIVSALMIVGIAIAIIALICGGWIALIVGLVIAAIGLIIKYLDYFLGVVYSIGAGIYNIIVGTIDGIIQAAWSFFVEPFISIIEWILNACNGGFNGVLGGLANFAGQLINIFLSLGKVVTKIIDAICGTNWTNELSELQNKVLSWGKKDDAITISREAPTLSSMTGGVLPERIAYGDAWNKGLEHGAAAHEAINKFGSQFQNAANKFNTDLPNINDSALAVNHSYDPSGANDDIEKALKDINGDTSDINDSMNLRDEDFEYMRKIAEMEWRNEFTTAEIKVDMTNYNSVNGERDLDGIVEYLAETIRDEMTSIATNGVHY